MDNLLARRINDVVEKNALTDMIWLFKSVPIQPIIQRGPQCGIVALCMALNYLNVKISVEELMNCARDLKFTKNGEIFDVAYMYELARKYHENTHVFQLISLEDERKLFEFILNNKLVLIVYDCDLNFEPCRKQGVKAHWVLISGFMVPININRIKSEDNISKLMINLNDEPSLVDQTTLNNLITDYIHNNVDENELMNKNRLFCFCGHGKSTHLGVWRLYDLIESNRQLKFIDEKCKNENYVIPADLDICRTLSAKYLVLD